MTTSQGQPTVDAHRNGRWWFVLAAAFAGLFAVNVVSRLLFIKKGMVIWYVGDVGEFLLVLVAMAFFVAGLLVAEESPESLVSPVAKNHKGGSS